MKCPYLQLVSADVFTGDVQAAALGLALAVGQVGGALFTVAVDLLPALELDPGCGLPEGRSQAQVGVEADQEAAAQQVHSDWLLRLRLDVESLP